MSFKLKGKSNSGLLSLIIKENANYLAQHHAEIGIYAQNSGGELVTIATAHEFGTETIPRRSFLELPITMEQRSIQQTFQAGLGKYLSTPKGAVKILEYVGLAAFNASMKGFFSEGFGLWKKLKPKTLLAKKGKGFILYRTGDLQNSIRNQVAKNKHT